MCFSLNYPDYRGKKTFCQQFLEFKDFTENTFLIGVITKSLFFKDKNYIQKGRNYSVKTPSLFLRLHYLNEPSKNSRVRTYEPNL
jgi:hypothetical protein